MQWDFDSLCAGASGNVAVTVNIPAGIPNGFILLASSDIATTDEDEDPSNNSASDPEEVVGSVDPNDKVVYPKGFAEKGYVAEGQKLDYTIYFENADTATADAIYILAIDTLDPDLDWNTLYIGPMSHPDKCSASFDTVAGVITWNCDSIMLPPNVNPPEGEAWVTFSIHPKYLSHGTEIANRVIDRFDYGPWFWAPEEGPVVNTIDEYPPNSRVIALWDTVNALDFEVNWKGTDDSLEFGSGVRSYTIYVSDNGDPYGIWIVDTSETSAVFTGELDHTYCFYSITKDSVGNIEDAPSDPDACTVTPSFLHGDADGNAVIDIVDVVYLVNYLFKGGPAPIPINAGDANCNGEATISDAVYLINYLFKSGPPPCP